MQRGVWLLQDDEDLQDELANAMQPMFRNAYGMPMRPYQYPRDAVSGHEEDDASPDEDEDEDDEPALHGGQVDPALMAELEASINDTHTFRESQRRRLQ